MRNNRRETDVRRLINANFQVEVDETNTSAFTVQFHGPPDTLYSEGVWDVYVSLPGGYPIESPSVGFLNKIFHPNIDWDSGSVCLDVLNQVWSPMYDLRNVFDVFLPQLMAYPNFNDPLNPEAASLMQEDKTLYESEVKKAVQTYATAKTTHISTNAGSNGRRNQQAATAVVVADDSSSDSDSSIASFSDSD